MYNTLFRFLVKTIGLTGLFVAVLTPLYVSRADHHKAAFPTSGMLWMSGRMGYSGLVYATSNNCNANETSAYARVKNSTTGTTEMAKWKNGIQMKQYRCDGAWDNLIDFKISYQAGYPSSSWGLNVDKVAESAFCQYWGSSYPCGVRSTVYINQSTWNGISTAASKDRLIMHETGHSLGLNHHCSADSIMNDGTSACNGGRWTSVMTYMPTDRAGINAVYP